MRIPTVIFFLCVSCAVFSSAADTKNIEQAIRDLDEQWAKAAAAKDVDKTVSYYSEDAIVLAPNAAALTTKDAIRSIWNGLLTSPGASVNWKTTRVEVAASGDMAYSTGTYELTMTDNGKAVNDHGKYLAVWEKQKDGSWKCGADTWNTDLPEKK